MQHSSLLWILHLKINYKTIRNLSSAMQSNPSYVPLVIDLWSHSSTVLLIFKRFGAQKETKISQKPMFHMLLFLYFQKTEF